MTATGYFGATSDAAIDIATHGYYWQVGADRIINWAIADGFYGEYWNSPEDTVSILESAFDAISQYIDVRFNYIGYYGDPYIAWTWGSDITISMDAEGIFTPGSATWAVGYFPTLSHQTLYYGQHGDVFLNLRSEANHLTSYAPGSAGFFLVLHEIGHTIGLKHPHDDGGTGRPMLASGFDRDWFSVMSYQDDYNFNRISWDPATLMPYDVYGLQYIYGKNTTTHAGNSTHYVTTSNLYRTVWDASGNDTVDAGLSSGGWTIQLPDESVSNLVDTKLGWAGLNSEASLSSPRTWYWLMGDFEHASGSAYADYLYGNRFSNMLQGRGGNDWIDGFGGIDTAVYASARSSYSLTRSGSTARVTISGRSEGIDTVDNVERFQFSDGILAFDLDGNAGQAYRLYQTAFDRIPDLGGLSFWIRSLDGGYDRTAMINYFLISPEFQALYGAAGSLSNQELVTLVYHNVLNRAPDPGGLAFWTGQLDLGMARADLLLGFSESPENKANVIGAIQNGIWFT